MASEPFTIEIASFDGGLSQAPYTGQPDQYSFATGLDQYAEPGSLVGQLDFERFTYGPQGAGSSLYMPPMAVYYDSESDNNYAIYRAVNDNNTVLDILSGNGSPSLGKEFTTLEFSSSSQWAWTTPLITYGGYVFFGNDSAVAQTNGVSNSSIILYSKTSYEVIDLATHFGYLYVGWGLGTGASDSSPSMVARYDATLGLIDVAANRLEPAVELELGWNISGMDVYGDFIAITAIPASGPRYDSWYTAKNSRIYIWDGISNTFDTKVDVNGAAFTACKTAGGQLYAFSSNIGRIDIYRYSGGAVTQRVASVSTDAGGVKNTQDINYPFVRNESVDVKGDLIYFGVTVPDKTSPRGYLYTFNIRTGVIDQIYRPSESADIRAISSFMTSNEMTIGGFFTAQTLSSSGRMFTTGSSDFHTTSDFKVTTSNFFAPSGKKMKIDRVLIRHSYVPVANAINVYINRNHELAPRTSGASYNTATTLVTVTGADANFPGVGDAGAYEHAYSFQTTDGSPVPLLDTFQLTIAATNSSGLDRTRIFLPIIVEGTLIDSPR